MAGINPKLLERVMSEVSQIRETLTNAAGALDVDVDEYLFVLEHDTDLMSIVDAFEERISKDRDYAARAKARASQMEKRAEAGRKVLKAIMERLDVRKLERPTFTASLAKGTPSLNLFDPDAVPVDYLVMTPDKESIKRDLREGRDIPGANLTNPDTVLRITRPRAPKDEEPSNAE